VFRTELHLDIVDEGTEDRGGKVGPEELSVGLVLELSAEGSTLIGDGEGLIQVKSGLVEHETTDLEEWAEKSGSTTKPLAITGFEKSGGFLVQGGQGPPHGVDDALGDTGASRGGGDAADDRDLVDSFVGSGRRANGGRLGINQFGGADGLDGHVAGLGVSVENELNLGRLQNGVHDILRPLGTENDGSTTGEPDSVSGSDIVDLEAHVKTDWTL
jgi:hypothetical protein